MQLNPYLNFKGQCEEAFKFYEQCLGGKIESMIPFEGSPMAESVPADQHNMILHASMTVGNRVLMGSDAPSDRYQEPHGLCVSLNVENPADADRIFNGLADKGKVTMPIDKTYFAERFGMVTDRFGIPWMVNCDKQD